MASGYCKRLASKQVKAFPETTRRNVLAVVVGPLALVPAIVLATLANTLCQGGSSDWQELMVFALTVSVIGLFFAYPLVLAFGVPAVLVLRHYQRLGFVPLAILGVLCALLLTLCFSPYLNAFLMFGYCSVWVVSGCWYAYKYTKP